VRVSPSLRYIFKIPYKTLDNKDDTKSAYFVDLTLRSRKFWKDRIDVSASVLNALDFQDPLPAYGEHINNPNGTIPPEGRKFSITGHMSL